MIAHWLVSALPLIVASPILAVLLAMDMDAFWRTLLSLLVGTPALAAFGAIGAAVTVSIRRGGLIAPVLIAPLAVPVLIFGVGAISTGTGPDQTGAGDAVSCGNQPHGAGAGSLHGGACDKLGRGLEQIAMTIETAPKQSWWNRIAHPGQFVAWSRPLLWPLTIFTALLFVVGLYFAFFNSPEDYQMGDTVRIMYVHVPTAWLSQFVYGVMAVSALGSLVWRHPMADVSMKAAAPAGRDLHGAGAVHRLALGPADLGHVLGMGRADDLDPGAAVHLSRHHRAVAGVRRPVARGAGDRGVHAGGRGQYSDHQVFGRLVEHAAPAGQRLAGRRAAHAAARS